MAELVDWALARRIALTGIGERGPAMRGAPDLAAAGERASAAVRGYTGLDPLEPLPEPEWVSRRDWIDVNLASVRDVTATAATRLGDAAERQPLASVAGRVLAVEIGALLGFAARHVLGQYEYPLLGGERKPRLLFVGENIDVAATQLGGEPDPVLDWIALHETTHSVQFAAAPWMRAHVGGLARTLLAEAPVRLPVAEILARAREIATSDPRQTFDEIRGSDPVSLLAPAESLATINSLQAVMASVEGYAEHVMDAAAGNLGAAVAELRAGLDARRRNRSVPVRILSWLFGFELKMRQYEQGKRFCDAVVATAGIAGLNGAWEQPETLPDREELADPEAWVERVLAAPAIA